MSPTAYTSIPLSDMPLDPLIEWISKEFGMQTPVPVITLALLNASAALLAGLMYSSLHTPLGLIPDIQHMHGALLKQKLVALEAEFGEGPDPSVSADTPTNGGFPHDAR